MKEYSEKITLKELQRRADMGIYNKETVKKLIKGITDAKRKKWEEERKTT